MVTADHQSADPIPESFRPWPPKCAAFFLCSQSQTRIAAIHRMLKINKTNFSTCGESNCRRKGRRKFEPDADYDVRVATRNPHVKEVCVRSICASRSSVIEIR